MRLLKAFCLGAVLLLCGLPDLGYSKTTAQSTAHIARDGNQWTVEFSFREDAEAWAFYRSNLLREARISWRVDRWKSLTPGVELLRYGGFDVITSTRGKLPRRVTFAFELEDRDVLADYDPALIFTSGEIGVFSGHFAVSPFSFDLKKVKGDYTTLKSFTDTKKAIWDNGQKNGSLETTDSRYVLFSEKGPVSDENFELLLDPGLPVWFREELLQFAPATVGFFTEQFGRPNLSKKPSLWVSWRGAGMKGSTMGGSVLPEHIVMAVGGSQLLNRSPELLDRARWFIAHEAAHFWLGETVAHKDETDAWISEGGANIAALLLLSDGRMEFGENKELSDELSGYVSKCFENAKAGAINTARARQNFDIYYNCGALFQLVASKMAREKQSNWFIFTKNWMAAERKKDQQITTLEWFGAVRKLGLPERVVQSMRIIHSGTESKKRVHAVELLVNYLGFEAKTAP